MFRCFIINDANVSNVIMNNFRDNNPRRCGRFRAKRKETTAYLPEGKLSFPRVASEEAGVFKVEKQLKGAASAGIRTKLGAPLERLVGRSSTLECALAAEAARFSGSWFPASCASSFFFRPLAQEKSESEDRSASRRSAVVQVVPVKKFLPALAYRDEQMWRRGMLLYTTFYLRRDQSGYRMVRPDDPSRSRKMRSERQQKTQTQWSSR